MSDAIELLKLAYHWWVPPHDAKPEVLRTYRLRHTVGGCIALVLSVAFPVACSYGLPYGLFSGFVTRTDMQALATDTAKQITSMVATDDGHWAEQLDSTIVTLRAKQCAAKNSEAKSLYWRMISQRISEWQDATKKPTYPLPACGDL